MKKIIAAIAFVSFIYILAGCSFGSSDTNNVFGMNISVSPDPATSKKNINFAASLNENIVNQGSWFLFEIRSPENKGSTWVPGNYEGKGVYTADTNLPKSGEYKVLGHFYAGGGFHYSQKINFQVEG